MSEAPSNIHSLQLETVLTGQSLQIQVEGENEPTTLTRVASGALVWSQEARALVCTAQTEIPVWRISGRSRHVVLAGTPILQVGTKPEFVLTNRTPPIETALQTYTSEARYTGINAPLNAAMKAARLSQDITDFQIHAGDNSPLDHSLGSLNESYCLGVIKTISFA